MRYRLMAAYRGVPYHVGLGPDGTDATLFSPAPPPGEFGFSPAEGHWRKQVSLTDLDALWQSRLVGDYRGEPCLVLDDLGDRLHIAYLGRDSARARQLGYWEIDREVFEVVVARQDIVGLSEERVEFPVASAMFPPSHGEPVAQVRQEARARQAAPGPGPAAPAGPGTPAAPGGQGGPGPAVSERTSPLRVVRRTGPQPAAPERVAAWHGSPEAGEWADPESRTASEPVAAGEFWNADDPTVDVEPWVDAGPGATGDPRAGSEPWAGPGPWARPEPWAEPGRWTESGRWAAADVGPPAGTAGRRAGRRERVPQSVFAELMSLAAIPHAAYAVDEEVPGAMCLVKADGGFEVFSRTDDARLDVRFFEDEEAAYFYLFGVLAAEAVRSGRLRPGGQNGHMNGWRGPGAPSAATPNVSKYLRRRKLPKSASAPAIVN